MKGPVIIRVDTLDQFEKIKDIFSDRVVDYRRKKFYDFTNLTSNEFIDSNFDEFTKSRIYGRYVQFIIESGSGYGLTIPTK